MKKIYSFIALMLMCFVGTTQAQRAWTLGENVTEETFKAGEGINYAIQEGDNTSMKGDVEQPGIHSKGHYLSSGKGFEFECITEDEVSHPCIYNFIEVSTNAAGFPVYVLKNVATGKYLANTNDRYVNTTAEAFKFTVRLGVAKPESETKEAAGWEFYSNAVSDTRSIHAVDNGGWVFCAPEKMTYMCFFGSPAFASYTDTNNWYIKPATEKELQAYEKLMLVFDQYFSAGVSEDIYPIGNQPGCISQEFFDRLLAVYSHAEALTGQAAGANAEECLQVIKDIEAIMAELPSQIVGVTPGYYVIQNMAGRGFLTVTADGKGAHGSKQLLEKDAKYEEWTPETMTSWNVQDAKSIWKVENAKEEGKILFKNFGTGQYLQSKDSFDMVDEPNGAFFAEVYDGKIFAINSEQGWLNLGNINDNYLTTYGKGDDASHFQFFPISQVVIDSLSGKIGQNQLNEKLAAAVKDINNDLLSLKYKNGFVNSGKYNFPADSGLVTSFMKVNSYASNEGSKTAPFDGKLNTYFHTAYKKGDIDAQGTVGAHWVQIDLGKNVKELVVKFTKRQGVANCHISSYELTAPESGDIEEPDWNLVLAKSADSILYDAEGDSTCHIARYTFDDSVRYFRFVPTHTRGRDVANYDQMTEGTGPMWHCAEMRFYDGAETVENPKFKQVPAEVMAELNAQIAKAEKELEANAATKATIDALKKAVKAFWDAYPNMNELTDKLELAQKMIDIAIVGPGLAQFEEGAKEAFQAEVDAINAEIKGKEDLTAAQIKAYVERLQKAQDAFNAKLHVPANGGIYRIVCKKPADFVVDEKHKAHVQWGGCLASFNADSTDTPGWRYNVSQAIVERFNTLWQVEQSKEGFAFRNLANGLYMNNPYYGKTEEEIEEIEGGWIGYSTTPKYFKFEVSSRAENAFVVVFHKNESLNFDPIGAAVHYGERDDQHGIFEFMAYDPEVDITESYNVDVEAGKLQIVSLPIDVLGVYTQGTEDFDGFALKVLGKRDGKIVLDYYQDGEEIPAGTPFIIKTNPVDASIKDDKGENTIEAVLPSDDIEVLKNLTYNYNAVNQNGMISTPISVKVHANMGQLVEGKLIPTAASQVIPAATGFFGPLQDMPEADPELEGVYFIEVEGVIDGIENAEIVKNVSNDVYSISGVKVRSNVKAASATKNLPKGVYIVGGKKVIVK